MILENLRGSTFIDKVIAAGDVNGDGIQNDGWIDGIHEIPFVALPCRKALKKWVRITLPQIAEVKWFDHKGHHFKTFKADLGCIERSIIVQVLDVGPYIFWDDFCYTGARPMIENLYDDTKTYEEQKVFPCVDYHEQKWSKISYRGKKPRSSASIDLTPQVWRDLGITDEILKNKFKIGNINYLSIENLIVEFFVDRPKEPYKDTDISIMPEWLRLD